MHSILILEDDRDLNGGLRFLLEKEGYQVFACYDLKSARAIARASYDLLLLDITLPDGNGLAFLKELKKKHPTLPIILLTAKDTDDEIVLGLEAGADDYITKPFSLDILRARIKAQLRRSSNTTYLVIPPYRFDFEGHRYHYRDEEIELSKTEEKLLKLLIDHREATLNRNLLLERIWEEEEEFVDDNALSVTVKRLRDKLKAEKYIRTVYGIGYRWSGPHHE